MNERIRVALEDERNGSKAAVQKRFLRTGSPFKVGDKRVRLFFNGESALSTALSNGISSQTFYKRLKLGWSVVDACTKKTGKQGKLRYDKDNGEVIPIPSVVPESI